MSTITAPPPSRRNPRRGSRRPARVLLDTEAVVGIHESNTTAQDRTRNGEPIQVSFCLKRPPQPSTLFVHSSDMNRSAAAPPEILYSADDLLLLRVNMRPRPPFTPWPLYDMDYDYFVYRADPSRPLLQLLRRPHPYLHKSDVGILPRSGGHYTIAALNFTGTPCQYEFHVFDSVTSTWRSNILSAPQHYDDSPVGTHSSDRARVHHHRTTTAITIGGKGGTIGWVDLWRGILLCDVLDSPPALRAMPLPSPSLESGGNAAQSRGISFISGKGRLNFVHMQIKGEGFTEEMDDETGWPSVRVDDWVLTTWSNKTMGSALEDWHKESMVRASGIAIDPAISRVLEDTGLLRRGNEATAAEQRGLQNISTYQPSPCVSGEDVVYLVAREKFAHPKAWILAVDMKNGGTLRSAAYFGIREYSGVHVIYCPSRISKYMNPAKYGDIKDAEDSHEDGAVKLIRLA